jgi:hypothetical protein
MQTEKTAFVHSSTGHATAMKATAFTLFIDLNPQVGSLVTA